MLRPKEPQTKISARFYFFNYLDKLDQVLDDTENTERMVNQVLYRSFTNQQSCDKALLPTGPEVQINEISFSAQSNGPQKWLHILGEIESISFHSLNYIID